MKSLRLALYVMLLLLARYLTLSSVNWSAVNPWNWFGSSTQVTEQGVGMLTGAMPLDEKAIADTLNGDYRPCSGMKIDNSNVVRFYEAMKGDKLVIVINGSQGIISRIGALDHDISSATGVEIGAPLSNLYTKAFGNHQKATDNDSAGTECKAEGSQHTSCIFSGKWSGSEDIMPSGGTLKAWRVNKIIWRR